MKSNGLASQTVQALPAFPVDDVVGLVRRECNALLVLPFREPLTVQMSVAATNGDAY